MAGAILAQVERLTTCCDTDLLLGHEVGVKITLRELYGSSDARKYERSTSAVAAATDRSTQLNP